MNKGRQVQIWIMRAAGVLLCLVLASTYLVCGLFARYTTSASGSDSARVAKFAITGTEIQTIDITEALSPGESEDYDLQIANNSEVAVEFKVTIQKQTDNLPLDFSVRLENDSELQESDQFVFTDQMDPGEMTIYKLYILWPEAETSPVYSDLVDYIQVTVDATQID